MYKQRSFVLKPETAVKKWYVVDVENKTLGRAASQLADLLRGKGNPQYTPNADSGGYVVVVNAEKIQLTGNKWKEKIYYRHSNHVGGLHERTAEQQKSIHPELLVYEAVKGMLPKSTLGRKQLTKLKIFVGPAHTHEAQKPEEFKLK